MLFDAPVIAPSRGLDPAWLDFNGHLNMAYYHVLFDQAADHVFEQIGCGPAYRAERNMSFFTAETHVCYVRELKPDAIVSASTRILDFDGKRIHMFQELSHVDGWLSATCESMSLHVDMNGPRTMVMPDDVLAKVTAMAKAHQHLPHPERAGRSIGLKRKQAGGAA